MQIRQRRGFQDQNTVLTLGDAVAAVSAVTADEREVVAVVLEMLRRESIRFLGAAPFPTCLTPTSVADGDEVQRRARDAERG